MLGLLYLFFFVLSSFDLCHISHVQSSFIIFHSSIEPFAKTRVEIGHVSLTINFTKTKLYIPVKNRLYGWINWTHFEYDEKFVPSVMFKNCVVLRIKNLNSKIPTATKTSIIGSEYFLSFKRKTDQL